MISEISRNLPKSPYSIEFGEIRRLHICLIRRADSIVLFVRCAPKNPNSARSSYQAHLIEPMFVSRFRIEGVWLKDSPFWTVHPYACDDVVVRSVRITADPIHGHNTDGSESLSTPTAPHA